jgi:hypothetical protein
MAKMLEFLQQKYPNTVSKFISDVTFNKYINLNEFEEMDFGSRYLLVKSFFGYEKRYDTRMSVEDMQKHIIYLFEDFETLNLRYPQGVPNFLKILNHMSNADKTEYLDKNYKSSTVISLHHALCPRKHFNEPSLKDALVARVLPIIEEIALKRQDNERTEAEFWINTIPQSKVKETIPF